MNENEEAAVVSSYLTDPMMSTTFTAVQAALMDQIRAENALFKHLKHLRPEPTTYQRLQALGVFDE